jgi:hypothetical protein
VIITMPTYDEPLRKLTDAELAARIEPILDILAIYRRRTAAYDAVCRQIGFSRGWRSELPPAVTRRADRPL